MSDKITEIVGQEAFDQVEKLKLELKQLSDTFENSAKVALLMNSALSNTRGIKDTSNAIKEQQSALSQLEKLEAKLAYQATETAKVEAKLRLEIQSLTQANKDFVKSQEAKVGSISSLRLQLKDLQKQYDNMASAEREASKGTDLLKHINDVDTQLKKLEAGSGRFQRNVGNYASGWSPLSSAMGQITRELPNFGQSLSIGVLSLTNNIGALQDAIKGIRIENEKLKSEGKPTTSALSQIGSALFSWNTVLYVGIGLFSAYREEITDFITNLFSTKKAIDSLNESQEYLNKALGEMSVKNAITNVNELRINIGLAKEGFIDKDQVVKQYNETIGKTTGLVSNIDEAEKQLGKNADAYVKMTLYKTAANLAMEQSAKTLLEAMKNEKQANKELTDEYGDAKGGGLSVILQQGTDEFKKGYQKWRKERENLFKQDKISKNEYLLSSFEADYNKALTVAKSGKSLRERANEELNIGKDLMKQASQLAKQMNFNIYGDTKPPKEPKAPKVKKEPKGAEVNRIDDIKKQYEREQKELEISLGDKLITEEEFYYKSIVLTSKFIAKRQGLSKKETESEIDLNLDLEKKANDFHDKLINNSLKELQIVEWSAEKEEKRQKEKYDAIKKKYKETYDGLNEQQKKNQKLLEDIQEKQKKKLEEYYAIQKAKQELTDKSIEASAEIATTITDRLIYNAERLAEIELKRVDAQEEAELASLDRLTLSENERAERRKTIELEAEARRKAIEKEKIRDLRKFALIQKSIDIAQIISSTALAIMRALNEAGVPFPVKVANAIGFGLTGAVQLAKVIATPLPQYAEGIESTPTDSLAIVGEKGTELITEKSGKQYLTPDTDTLTFLPKGTKVTPHHELMANVYDNAHKYMANSSSITTDTMQTALIQSFEELYNKVDNLTEIMAKKNMNVSIFGDFEHAMRIKKSRM